MSESKPDRDTLLDYYTEVVNPTPDQIDLLPKSCVIEAQQLFMLWTPIIDIARETGIPITLLQQVAYQKGGWRDQRAQINKEVVEQVRQKARKRFQKALGVSIRMVTNGLLAFEKRLQTNGREMTLEEISDMTLIAQRLDRTNILKEVDEEDKKKSKTPKDLIKAIANDPYMRKAIMLAGQKESLVLSEIEEEIENEVSDSLANPK